MTQEPSDCLPLVLDGGKFIYSAPFIHTCDFVALVSSVSATRSATGCHVCQICTEGSFERSDFFCQSKNLGIFGIKFRIFVGSNHVVVFISRCSRKIIIRHMIVQYYTRINIILDSLDEIIELGILTR